MWQSGTGDEMFPRALCSDKRLFYFRREFYDGPSPHLPANLAAGRTSGKSLENRCIRKARRARNFGRLSISFSGRIAESRGSEKNPYPRESGFRGGGRRPIAFRDRPIRAEI